jgi:hypothetical protein
MHSAKRGSSRNTDNFPNNRKVDSSSSRIRVHGAIKLLTQLRRSVISNTYSSDKDSSGSDNEATLTSKQHRQRIANAPSISTVPMVDVGDAFEYGRDRRDSSGKTYRVVVPKKLLLWVGVIFFGLPIFLFLYMEGTRYYFVNNKSNSSDFQTKVTNANTTTDSSIVTKTEQGKQPQGFNENVQPSVSSTITVQQSIQKHPDIHIDDKAASANLIEDNSEKDYISDVAEEIEEVTREEDDIEREEIHNETLPERSRL